MNDLTERTTDDLREEHRQLGRTLLNLHEKRAILASETPATRSVADQDSRALVEKIDAEMERIRQRQQELYREFNRRREALPDTT